ncbi:protein NIM1-INTERACTING 2 [Sesamum indicum]|uniref:Protein NIM1-INTERACTING 2 n=1 Tax=Sesamum indicum TaxID=4182 RepID=A0A6I9U7Y6_SESIN|nr:protein NIM1-INTERACTING 2 [Sesamum indicum]
MHLHIIIMREREREEMEMEKDRKRKRVEKGEAAIGGGQMSSKAQTPVVAPTEEEVEEFFAILRRMHVAVKYFQKGVSIGDELPSAAGYRRRSNRAENGGLDLNAVPEPESNSD